MPGFSLSYLGAYRGRFINSILGRATVKKFFTWKSIITIIFVFNLVFVIIITIIFVFNLVFVIIIPIIMVLVGLLPH